MTAVRLFSRVAGACLIGGLALAALAGAIALVLGRDGWTLLRVVLAGAVVGGAWWRPLHAACLLLALAPLAGNRPTTPQVAWLIWLTALAVPAWLARLATVDRAAAGRVLGAPVGLATLAYAGVSLLSLSSLPLYALPDLVGATSMGAALAAAPRALVTADVITPVYPVLSVVLTLHAAVAALTIAVALAQPGTDDARAVPAAQVAVAIALGLALAVGVGLLDYVAVVDLRKLRAFDPFTNASGAERMQSTFGHAGWLAEYVCFTTPALLTLWLTSVRLDARLRAAATALGLGAALVVIVLSYQRGGWITWLVVAAGVVFVALRWWGFGAPRDGATPRAGRLALIAAAGVVVTIGVGIGVVRVAGGSGAMARFAERARSITQVSDRQNHVMAGLRLGALLPVLGGGSESFAIRYRQEYLLSGGEYYAKGYSPLMNMYGSAHNVFAQTFAGKGAAGLLSLSVLVLVAAWAAWRVARDPARAADVRLIAIIALGTIGAFALYGQVQEVFYIQALQITVFGAVGVVAGLALPAASGMTARRAGLVAVALLVVLGAHVAHAWVSPGRLAEGYRDYEISRAGERLGGPEPDGEGGYFQWTTGAAFVTVPRQATALSFDLRSLAPNAQVVEVRLDDRLVDRVQLGDHGWHHVEYPLGKLRELPRRLQFSVQPTWREPGGTRELGVGDRRIRWGTE
jgi:hypothetical protein